MIKLRTVLDNSGQFWTVLDKMLCYNGRVKDDGSGLSVGHEHFHAQCLSLDAEQFTLYRMSVTLAR